MPGTVSTSKKRAARDARVHTEAAAKRWKVKGSQLVQMTFAVGELRADAEELDAILDENVGALTGKMSA